MDVCFVLSVTGSIREKDFSPQLRSVLTSINRLVSFYDSVYFLDVFSHLDKRYIQCLQYLVCVVD